MVVSCSRVRTDAGSSTSKTGFLAREGEHACIMARIPVRIKQKIFLMVALF
jgi:hypothetical protein